MIIGLFVLYLCLSIVYFYIRSLGQTSTGGSGTTTSLVPSTTVLTATNSNGSSTSTRVLDNFSLAQLETLSFANSSKCNGLLDPAYWDTAISTSGNTTAHLIPNTVYSLAGSWNGWTDFFRTNMSNPPPWLPAGLANYTS